MNAGQVRVWVMLETGHVRVTVVISKIIICIRVPSPCCCDGNRRLGEEGRAAECAGRRTRPEEAEEAVPVVRVPARRLLMILNGAEADGAVTISGDVDEGWRTAAAAVAVAGVAGVAVAGEGFRR